MASKLKHRLAKTPECLTVDELYGYLSRQAADGRCRQHLKMCPACRTELELLKTFQDPQLSADERNDVEWITVRLAAAPLSKAVSGSAQALKFPAVRTKAPRKPFWNALLGWKGLSLAAAAAALLLAIGIGLQQPEVPTEALPTGPGVLRSAPLDIVAPRGPLSGVPSVLEWKGAAGNGYFEVSIYRVDRTLLWESKASGQTISLPASVQQQLRPGTRYLWQVTARTEAGDRMAVSQLESFQITEENR